MAKQVFKEDGTPMSMRELADIIPKLFGMEDLQICPKCYRIIDEDHIVECNEPLCENKWCDGCRDEDGDDEGGFCYKCTKYTCGECGHNCDERWEIYKTKVGEFYQDSSVFKEGNTNLFDTYGNYLNSVEIRDVRVNEVLCFIHNSPNPQWVKGGTVVPFTLRECKERRYEGVQLWMNDRGKRLQNEKQPIYPE